MSIFESYRVMRGPWECNPKGGTVIVAYPVDGGDPITIARIQREHHKEHLDSLVELANLALTSGNDNDFHLNPIA